MKKKFKIVVKTELCKRCSICEYICPNSVFQMKDSFLEIYDERCKGCNICELICPDCAISVIREEKNETIYSRK